MTAEQMKARIAELEAELYSVKRTNEKWLNHMNKLGAERDALKVQVHDLNWAIGTPGYEQLHNPEDQQAHEAAVAGTTSLIKRLADSKAEHDAMALDAQRYRWLRESWGATILERLFGIEFERHLSVELDAAIDNEIKESRK